jgi:hypothetical protein
MHGRLPRRGEAVTLQRRKPLARGKALARSTRLAPVNRKRKAETYARNFGDRGSHVRALNCLGLALDTAHFFADLEAAPHEEPDDSLACSGPTQAAHARARGMGGAKGDRRDLVPLCQRHHVEAGELGTSQRADFERLHGISLTAEAARIAAELDAKGIP